MSPGFLDGIAPLSVAATHLLAVIMSLQAKHVWKLIGGVWRPALRSSYTVAASVSSQLVASTVWEETDCLASARADCVHLRVLLSCAETEKNQLDWSWIVSKLTSESHVLTGFYTFLNDRLSECVWTDEATLPLS